MHEFCVCKTGSRRCQPSVVHSTQRLVIALIECQNRPVAQWALVAPLTKPIRRGGPNIACFRMEGGGFLAVSATTLHLGQVRRQINGEPAVSCNERLGLRGLRFSHNAHTVFIRLERHNPDHTARGNASWCPRSKCASSSCPAIPCRRGLSHPTRRCDCGTCWGDSKRPASREY